MLIKRSQVLSNIGTASGLKPYSVLFTYISFFFFSNALLQNFWRTNHTIVFLGFALPNLWQSSMSDLEIVKFSWLNISITLSSSSLSLTVEGIPWISILFLLVYCSDLFSAISISDLIVCFQSVKLSAVAQDPF